MNKRKENQERIKVAIELQKREKRTNLNQMFRNGEITKEEFDRKIAACI